jgi:hypothetical protein
MGREETFTSVGYSFAQPTDEDEFVEFRVWVFDSTERELYSAVVELVTQFVESTRA